MTILGVTRREFVAALGGAAAWPLGARAQRSSKVYRIGVLETTSMSLNAANLDAFRQGLRERGYVEGQNFVIEYRSADGRGERFPGLAAELIRLNVDLILTRGTPAAQAAKKATESIPIVMAASGEPVVSGLVTSLARPGKNVTGLSALTQQLQAKRLALFKEMLPGMTRIAALTNMSNPILSAEWHDTEMAGGALGVQTLLVDVRRPEDIARAFDTATRERADAAVVSIDTVTQSTRVSIVEFAAKHRLPAIYSSREFVDAGGLISYGVSFPDLYRRAATYVDKILSGARPGDLPVEQPTKFELVINLTTAKALGLEIPPSLLARADEVIE
jgi:putative ABC transport system substrate-binding protein